MNKKGFIKIIEAFIAILLISGVLIFIVTKGYIGKKDINEEVYDLEISILKEISLNERFRNDILSAELNSGENIKWNNFESKGLKEIKDIIISKTPSFLNCEARICILNEICVLDDYKKEVYAQAIAITANEEIYSPRQLKLFCWEKG